jgi:hypothetical protein
MNQIPITRRVFLAVAGAAGVAGLTGCGSGSPAPAPAGPIEGSGFVAYRFSTRGKRASKAAKAHAANKLFSSAAAAESGRAHPGDNSDIVTIDVSEATWKAYFGGGATSVDLR